MGMAISDPKTYYQLLTGEYDAAPNTKAGNELEYIRTVAYQSNEYGKAVKEASEKGSNKSTLYPTAGTNRLADQLKIVANLISGGLKTRVYVVTLGGFDTHAAQVDITAGTDKGSHANLLGMLSEAIQAFQDDVELLGLDNRVLGMTFSEFGRRIASNFSYGTDHGAAAPLFLFGKNVKGGIVGNNPQIPSTVQVNDNLAMQFDFRSVYASVLKNWFCLPDTDVETVMLDDFSQLPLLEDSCSLGSAQRDTWRKSGDAYIMNYPNPFNRITTVKFESDGKPLLIQIVATNGQILRTLVDDSLPQGVHEVQFDSEGLAPGTYFCRYQRGDLHQSKAMLKIR
jgi:hypothetical protein